MNSCAMRLDYINALSILSAASTLVHLVQAEQVMTRIAVTIQAEAPMPVVNGKTKNTTPKNTKHVTEFQIAPMVMMNWVVQMIKPAMKGQMEKDL